MWAACCAVAGLVAAVPVLSHRGPTTTEPIRVASVTVAPVSASVASRHDDAAVYVHVAGEVARPGLYRMSSGARVMDAVTGAGGATANADLNLLNLAAPLRDGQKLFVPRTGDAPTLNAAPEPVLVRADSAPVPETPISLASNTSHPRAPGKFHHPGDGVVRLNSASEAELEQLPGVGPSTASKIMIYRSAHGGFRTVEELMEVKGIGPKKLAKMRPFVLVP